MKSLRTNPPAVRTHGLRKLGKIKPVKPPHEHDWIYHSDWPDLAAKRHYALYKCSTCEAEVTVKFNDLQEEISREDRP